MSDQVIATIWKCCTVIVVAFFVCVFSYTAYNTKKFTENGYVEQSQTGTAQSRWVKP